MSKWSIDGQAEDVERAIEEYELTEFKRRVDGIWDRDDENKRSTLQLTRDCNIGIVSTVIDRVGTDHPEYTAREIALQFMPEACQPGHLDQLDEQKLNEIKNWFEQQEHPVADFIDDFVNHHSVHSYLHHHPKAPGQHRNQSPEDLRLDAVRRIGGLQIQSRDMTQSILERLKQEQVIDDTEYSIQSSLQVRCENCQLEVSAVDYIDYGGCPNCLTER